MEYQGEQLTGRASALADGVLTLAMSRGRSVELPIQAITPAAMADDLRLKARDLGDKLLRGYAMLLSTDGELTRRARSDLKRAGEAGKLLAQQSDRYAELLERGPSLESLADLADAGLPIDAASAALVLDRLRVVCAAAERQQLVAPREAELTRLARRALALVAEHEGAAFSRGGVAISPAQGGAARVVVDLSSEAALRQAFHWQDPLPGQRERHSALGQTVERPVRTRVGALVLHGEAGLLTLRRSRRARARTTS